MITKDDVKIYLDNNPASNTRVIIAQLNLKKSSNLTNKFQCDSEDHAGHMLAEQLKRSLMQQVYNDVTADLIELTDMVGMSDYQMRQAISDKVNKYQGVIDE